MSRAIVLVLLAGLAACVSQTRTIERSIDSGAPLKDASPTEDRRVHVDLIRQMIAQNNNYAALAHIEAEQRNGNSDELRLLEADARRKLGQSALAQSLYQNLVNTPYAAQAYHGLGLIAAIGNPELSLSHLRRASQLAPTDVELRNDLGYALMLSRRYSEALPQLATAVELAPGSEKSRNNLLLLMMLMRDERSVQRIVRDSNVDAETVAGLRKQAQTLAALPPRSPGADPAAPPKPAAKTG